MTKALKFSQNHIKYRIYRLPKVRFQLIVLITSFYLERKTKYFDVPILNSLTKLNIELARCSDKLI